MGGSRISNQGRGEVHGGGGDIRTGRASFLGGNPYRVGAKSYRGASVEVFWGWGAIFQGAPRVDRGSQCPPSPWICLRLLHGKLKLLIRYATRDSDLG